MTKRPRNRRPSDTRKSISVAVDAKAENWLRRRLEIARANRDKAARAAEKARKRRAYWAGIVSALETRLGLVVEGQTEFDFNGSDRRSDPLGAGEPLPPSSFPDESHEARS